MSEERKTPVTVTGPAPGTNASGLATNGAEAVHGINKPLGTARLRPAAIFSHDMVLQRRRPIPVFGTGEPGRTVVVTLRAGTANASHDAITLCTNTPAGGPTQPSDDIPTPAKATATSAPGPASSVLGDATDAPASHSRGNQANESTVASPTSAAPPISTSDAVSAFGTIDDHGNWSVDLPALEAGGPYELTISDHSGITLKYLNVYVGEVWLAGGQSNMEVELRNSDHADEAVAASADPLLRFYNTPKSGVIDTDLEDQSIWQVCGPKTSGCMSAVAYYFARKLRAELGSNVPVGIVDCYIGGTSITAWMSRETLETSEAGRGYLKRFNDEIAGKTDEQFAAETVAWQTKFDAWNTAIGKAREAEPDITWDTLNARYGECPWPPPTTPTSQYRPTGPFGTMVERVAPYSIAGFLWYQGESDETYCDSYRELLDMLIDEWRGLWHDEALPFLIVQLPQWIAKSAAEANADPMYWPVIRAAQWDVAHAIARVYAITTIDCGEFDNLHPTDKRTPGERLADCALHHVYGRTDIAADGPTLASCMVQATADDDRRTVTLRFDHANGLHFDGTVPGTYGANDNDPSRRSAADSGFEIAGVDGIFRPAEAVIIDQDHAAASVMVRSAEVARPTVVRYAWRSWGPAPLFGGNGLPAAPFSVTVR